MTWQPLLALPARVLAPLLLVVLAMLTAGVNYWAQVREYGDDVAQQHSQRLRERLGVEQSRLEMRMGLGDTLQVRRLVSSLGLFEGVTHAWLIDGNDRVVAGLSRLDQGRTLAQVLTPLRQAALATGGEHSAFIHIHPIAGEAALLGHVAIQPDHQLLVRLDLSVPLAARLYAGRGEILRQAGMILLFAALLAVLLHGLWFRRTARLTATAEALGSGRMATRAGLTGRDELASIGAALDRMAADLQQRQAQISSLAGLIEHSPVVAIAWHNAPGWPVSFVSDNIRQFGYSREQLLTGTLNYADLIHPEDRPRIEADVAEHLAHSPDDYRQEYRLRHGNGHWLWLEDRTWLSRDGKGLVTDIHGVLLDISARRQLMQSLDTVANASPALFWTAGLDKGCDWFNRRWLEFTGRSLAQELGNGWAEGVHPDDLEGCLAIYIASFDARQPFSMEYRLRRHDGEYRWLLDRGLPRYDADGEFIGFIGSCLDIGEEKRMRDQIEQSEAHYRHLFEHNPAPMLIYERGSLNLMDVNEAFQRHYGYRLEEALTLKLTDLYPKAEQDAIVELARGLHGHAYVGAWHHRTKTGALIDIVAHSHDLEYQGRDCRVAVITDISTIRQAEQALRQRNAELEQFNTATVERELKMIELKREVNTLALQLGQLAPYALDFSATAEEHDDAP